MVPITVFTCRFNRAIAQSDTIYTMILLEGQVNTVRSYSHADV